MAQVTAASLRRLRAALRRHLARGFERAVFASVPGGQGDGAPREELLEGPGVGIAEDVAGAQLEGWIARAQAAAQAGLVKHTWIFGPRRRLTIDARHGAATVKELDEGALRKRMGGKDRPLRLDASAPFLRVIGLTNADGTMSANHARKYKQVNHFVELCRPAWEAALAQPRRAPGPLRIVDLGCGNGYLGFVLAEALHAAGIPARLHGVDRREDVISRARERAAALPHLALHFEVAAISEAAPPIGAAPDLVLALHACDEATDDALAWGVRHGAAAILAAPCCQASLARELPDHPELAATPALVRHGLLRREYAAVLTDALRVDALEALGWSTDVLEFVASEHTAKNLLLRALRRRPLPAPAQLERLASAVRARGLVSAVLEAVMVAGAAESRAQD